MIQILYAKNVIFFQTKIYTINSTFLYCFSFFHDGKSPISELSTKPASFYSSCFVSARFFFFLLCSCLFICIDICIVYFTANCRKLEHINKTSCAIECYSNLNILLSVTATFENALKWIASNRII